MRLTLRTLLAYLDDVLDPVDKEELAKKIESSEFAEDLVHRTRDTVRRLRLSAPQVIGTGMGLDPNTVAEYLDNVMPPEQVGDFERICLESDVHLAEATACHHVLTMVLGEPADVDPIARQRMYTIASEATDRKQLRVEPAHTAAAAAGTAIVPTQPPATPAVYGQQPRSLEIPEYLRAGSWWRSTNAVIGLAAVVLIGTALVFLSSMRGWLGGKPAQEPVVAQNESSAPPLDVSPSVTPPLPAAPVDTTESGTATTKAPPPLASPPQPLTPGIAPAAAAPAPPAAATSPPAAATSTEPDPYAGPSAPVPPVATAPSQPAAADVGSAPGPPQPAPIELPNVGNVGLDANISAAAPPTLPPPAATAPPDNNPAPPPTAVADAGPAALAGGPLPPPIAPAPPDTRTPPDSTMPPVAGPPAAPPDSGTYMGGKTVLLRHDDKAGAWFRVEPRSAVIPGERILSLPEFRPRIALVSGVQLDLTGGTQIIIGIANEAASADGPAVSEVTPALELVYGRVVLVNPTNAEKQIRLKLGPNGGVARLGRHATLAVEVEHKHVPGQDPRQAAAPVEIRLYAPEGGLIWHDAAGDKTIEKPARWTLTEGGATDVAEDAAPPEWIDHEPVVQLSEQRYGAPVIESTLVSNTPADTQLLELFQGSSRKEVKSLVARSCIHVGLFQPFIDALRDSEQKANWKSHIDTLREAMALNPESANKVYQAIVDQRGKPAAAEIYEMLCGYNADQVGHTPEQMKTGAIAKLIGRLEDDSLDYRVLAIQDLWEITGKRLMPNPSASLPERAQNVKRWRARLDAGELKPTAQP